MNDQARNVSNSTISACPLYSQARYTHKQHLAARQEYLGQAKFGQSRTGEGQTRLTYIRPIPIVKDDTLDRIFALPEGHGLEIPHRFPERFGKLLHDTLGPRFGVSWSMPGASLQRIIVVRRTAKDLRAKAYRAAILKAQRIPEALKELYRAERVEENWGL